MANSYVYKHKPSFNSLTKHKILQKSKYNKDILITQQNEGNDGVILNRDDYIKSKANNLEKNRKWKEDPTLKRERALQRILLKILDIEYSNLYP